MIKYLKKSLLIPCLLLIALQMTAQDKQYYIYIQSERSQPFYVRFDGKLLSSSDKGYLIISKLPAGTANMRIGFAKSEVPEQQYLVKVGGSNDQGYLLKQDGLYNLVTFAATRPVKKGEEPAVAAAPAPVVETPAPAPAPVTEVPAPAPVETAVTPASPAPEPQKAMMDSMQKDLAAAFPNKEAGVTVGPGTRPVKPTNKFSESLDRVVKDDRPEEPLVDPNAGTGMILAPAKDTTLAVQQHEEKKGRKKRRDREPLTEEEQQILADVMAEEHKAAATSAPAADLTVTTDTAVTVVAESAPAPAPVVTEDAAIPDKKAKKAKKKKSDDPAFIDFQDGSNAQATPSAAVDVATVSVASAVEEPAPAPVSKKKKRKTDTEERPNNVLTDDSSGYAVSDLNIDHTSKKDRKKKKQDVEEGAVAAAEVPAVATEDTKKSSSSVKMINSDCGKVMDEDAFRKLLRKFVGGKDDDGMIDAFKKQTKGYCLETSQVKTLVQLLGTDDSRYRLLDQAYPKVYDSEHFAALESVLSDSYYKGRFKAMVHR
ncbi:DUF4476 domain-containing protein [Chitinophaga sancti]|uniref:DUF4476 domain-containing protein n=1 Tax=Chitinophaga sancti TaxID=1004 RepID=UPI002A7524B4|nr:DUF4476 domain-containing protein [Chitinophaga sancti]WPQ64875.1 DUF4476 domain-containing protein [Chitinophaga sancti]